MAIGAYLFVCLWLVFTFLYRGQATIVVCPSKLLFHIPCPGCGLTRATVLFLSGHVVDALSLNPNVLFSMGYLMACPVLFGLDAIVRKGWTRKAYETFDRVMKIRWIFVLFCIFEAGVWIHNIICHI